MNSLKRYFPFENLKLYDRSMELAVKISKAPYNEKTNNDCLNLLKQKVLLLPQVVSFSSVFVNEKDRAKYLREAMGTCYQIIPLLDLAMKLGFLAEEIWEEWKMEIERISRMISNLVFSLENKNKRGGSV